MGENRCICVSEIPGEGKPETLDRHEQRMFFVIPDHPRKKSL